MGESEYYIEWWKLGDEDTDIQSGNFNSSHLKNFIRLFGSLKKYSLIYLKRCSDDKVLYNRRTGGR